jgi:large subunit ribosomal protein L9
MQKSLKRKTVMLYKIYAIKSATGNDIDRHSIKITGHIKKIGKHTAKVSLAHAVVASVNITVVSA